ncbi:MAG: alpha/beta hydrolase [Nocardioides sp.]
MQRWGTAAAVGMAVLGLVLTGLGGTVSADASRASATLSRITVGGEHLHRCHIGAGRTTYCGSLRVPLDYRHPRAATIKVGFGWVPSTGAPGGTLVAMEGGPGYPSTGTSGDFVTMFGGLTRDHDVLLVNARGTGRSTPLNCHRMQRLASPSPRFQAALTACGRQLNHTWRRRDGHWVHASDLFTTANTARDVDRVLDALQMGKVDLYGDSYGTFFAQTFLAHFPGRLRSVVLDSAYEARDLDPLYRTTPQTARRAFDAVCRRAVGCARGSSWRRVGALARALRKRPITGDVVGTDDRRHRYTVDVTALVNVVNDAGYDTDPYRQLDAAMRAYLRHRDPTPLLRLYAQDVGYDYSDYVRTPPTYYSDAIYFAIACTDYPQLFDLHRRADVRRRELAARLARVPRRVFAPFTAQEWSHVLGYTEAFRACLTWPSPTHRSDPPIPRGPMNPDRVPVLVLNGSLDSLTPAAGGAHVARQIGPQAHAYVAQNNVHLVALTHDGECGARVLRRFVRAPRARLRHGCLSRIPPIRAVPSFPRTLAAATPATGHAPVRWRRLAAVAVAAAGDGLVRYDYVDGYRDLGLRGGRIRYDHAGDETLHGLRWTVDTRIDGRVRLTRTGARGVLRVTGPGGATRRVVVRWGRGRFATAVLNGVPLHTPAPSPR